MKGFSLPQPWTNVHGVLLSFQWPYLFNAMPLKKIQEKCTDLRDGRGRTGIRIKVLESPWLWPWIRTWWISSPTFLPMVSLHRGSKQCERVAGSSVTFPAKARESGPWCCGTSTEAACCRRWSGSGTQVLWTYMRVCRAQGIPGEEWGEYGGRTKHCFLVDLSTLWIHFSGTMLFSCFFFSPVYLYWVHVRVHKEESVVGYLPEKTARTWFQANRKSLLAGQQPLWVFWIP